MIASAPQRVAMIQAVHRRLRLGVRRIESLCRQPLDDARFFPAFIQEAAAVLDASLGAVWVIGEGAAPQCRWPSRSSAAGKPRLQLQRRRRLVARAAAAKCGLVFQSPAADSPFGLITIVAPVQRAGRCAMVIELQKLADAAAGASRHWLKLVEHLAAMAEKRLQAAAAAATGRQSAPWRTFSTLALAMHESLDLEATADAIVNESRRLLGCDRVSLVSLQGDRCRLLAVSGQDVINLRSDAARQLRRVAQAACRIRAAIWCDAGQPLPEPLASLGAAAGIDSSWKKLGIYPLWRPAERRERRHRAAEQRLGPRNSDEGAVQGPGAAAEKPIGALVIEQINPGASDQELAVRGEFAAAHAAVALASAQDHADILFLPLWKSLVQLRRAGLGTRTRRRLLCGAVALAAAAVLAMFPVDFHVYGRGALQPVVQRHVFADLDGVVAQVRVEHGDRVRAGDVLAVLHNSDIEVQIAQVLGHCRAAQEQLAAIQRRRHDQRLPQEEQDRLAGQMLQLQEQLRGLSEQHALLREKQQRLTIRSPISGQVTTWNVARQLMLRPVSAGQVLLTVADDHGPWELEVYFPESEIGHLTAARRRSSGSLPVDYLAVTSPTAHHAGTLRRIDAHAQLYDEHGHAVRALIDVNRRDVSDAPAGATVAVRVDCGRRAMGYVWLHRLWAFFYDRILFRLG